MSENRQQCGVNGADNTAWKSTSTPVTARSRAATPALTGDFLRESLRPAFTAGRSARHRHHAARTSAFIRRLPLPRQPDSGLAGVVAPRLLLTHQTGMFGRIW